jgi:hypothetical protein
MRREGVNRGPLAAPFSHSVSKTPQSDKDPTSYYAAKLENRYLLDIVSALKERVPEDVFRNVVQQHPMHKKMQHLGLLSSSGVNANNLSSQVGSPARADRGQTSISSPQRQRLRTPTTNSSPRKDRLSLPSSPRRLKAGEGLPTNPIRNVAADRETPSVKIGTLLEEATRLREKSDQLYQSIQRAPS